MQGQPGFWDIDERYARLSGAGDPLERLNAVVPWEVFRKPLAKSLKRSDGVKGGRPAGGPAVAHLAPAAGALMDMHLRAPAHGGDHRWPVPGPALRFRSVVTWARV